MGRKNIDHFHNRLIELGTESPLVPFDTSELDNKQLHDMSHWQFIRRQLQLKASQKDK